MSVLVALNRAYERLADQGSVPPFGYSSEKIGFVIPLNEDGTPAGLPIDLRDTTAKKPAPRVMSVPQPVKRTSGIASNFLWDKTSYVLGVTGGEGRRIGQEHAEFVKRHAEVLRRANDSGLLALLRFVEAWTPEQFVGRNWPEDMKDQNVVFALESERLNGIYIHDRPGARALWARLSEAGSRDKAACLVTGENAPIARLHPAIKGVWGAQSSGASLVSFNLDAFTSYGHEQGDNAPVSEVAAFGYTAALNKFLERNSRQRIQIGDASTVFWADASAAEAEIAEAIFGALLGDISIDEAKEAGKVRASLEKIRAGRPGEIAPELLRGVRFFVLGLAPNAARLSIRFWLEDDFGAITKRFADFTQAMRLEPPPREEFPSMWRCLIETAAQRKSDNIPPNLAGEWLRAILTGTRYPLTLLATVLMRLRADKDVSALRVAIVKAVLVNRGQEVPVAFDPENREPGYLLGRLFATYEHIQGAALGRGVNATVKDKFYGAASATPNRVFRLLDRGSVPHLAKVRKERPGHAVNLEKDMGAIMDLFDPSRDPFPSSLPQNQQGLFAVGYYHQRNRFFAGKDGKPETGEEKAR